LGYDYLLPVSFCHNMAESGASFGAALRMKNKELRSAAFTTSFSAFLGISEPALFTVNVANKTPLISAMIANGIGGALTVILGAKCYAFVMPGITSLPVYANGGLGNLDHCGSAQLPDRFRNLKSRNVKYFSCLEQDLIHILV
jgi:PTS system beta-glucosides-specific IIC component